MPVSPYQSYHLWLLYGCNWNDSYNFNQKNNASCLKKKANVPLDSRTDVKVTLPEMVAWHDTLGILVDLQTMHFYPSTMGPPGSFVFRGFLSQTVPSSTPIYPSWLHTPQLFLALIEHVWTEIIALPTSKGQIIKISNHSKHIYHTYMHCLILLKWILIFSKFMKHLFDISKPHLVGGFNPSEKY